MNSPEISKEFQELQNELLDLDPIVRGIAAVDLGSFAVEHPEYKDRIISILQKVMDDPDNDVQNSVKTSLALIQGEQILVPGQKIIGFGYIPEEYQQSEPDQKQMILSCVCCIIMIVTLSLMLIYVF